MTVFDSCFWQQVAGGCDIASIVGPAISQWSQILVETSEEISKMPVGLFPISVAAVNGEKVFPKPEEPTLWISRQTDRQAG